MSACFTADFIPFASFICYIRHGEKLMATLLQKSVSGVFLSIYAPLISGICVTCHNFNCLNIDVMSFYYCNLCCYWCLVLPVGNKLHRDILAIFFLDRATQPYLYWTLNWLLLCSHHFLPRPNTATLQWIRAQCEPDWVSHKTILNVKFVSSNISL